MPKGLLRMRQYTHRIRQLSMTLFLVLGAAVSLPAQNHTGWSSAGTLIVVTFARDGIAIGTDTAMNVSDTETRKLQPLKTGAIAMTGASIVTGGPGQRLLIVDLIERWIKIHPTADADSASKQLPASLERSINQFIQRNKLTHSSPLDADDSRFDLIFIGLVQQRPYLTTVKFFESPVGPTMYYTTTAIQVGTVHAFGIPIVCDGILHHSTPKALTQYEAAFSKLRGRIGAMSAVEALEVCRICLEASESVEAHRHYPETLGIRGPNEFGTITYNGGFRWHSLERPKTSK